MLTEAGGTKSTATLDHTISGGTARSITINGQEMTAP
jgi:hypothetical protein